MFSFYDPTVKATIAFLKMLGVRVNDNTVSEVLQSHPDWPSILSISDALRQWHVPNGATRIDKEDVDRLPVPFMAHTPGRECQFPVVVKVTEEKIVWRDSAAANPVEEDRKSFFDKWSGICLIAEPDENSGEAAYAEGRRKQWLSSMVPALLLAGVLCFLGFSFYRTVLSVPVNWLPYTIQFVLLMGGVFVTTLLLWYEIDRNNPALQKVCTGYGKTNCNAILTSKQAKLFNWLSWSEVGFFYFTGGLLCLLFSGNSLVFTGWATGWLSLLALPYTLFSVYYQWRVAKQWCVLCLAVQLLLVAGAANVVFFQLFRTTASLSVEAFISIAFLYALPVLLWYTIKPAVLRLHKAKSTKRELLRLKFNTSIFNALLEKQKRVDVPTEGLGIWLGNPNAKHQLVKVCNPYCGPCSRAHPKIEKLLEANPDVSVRIIFSASNKENDKAAAPVKHLMAIAGRNDEAVTKRALDDWYLVDKKEYEVFAKKYPVNGELAAQGDAVEAMREWCDKMQIRVTPTIFIDNYQLPDVYGIEDLEYFLSE